MKLDNLIWTLFGAGNGLILIGSVTRCQVIMALGLLLNVVGIGALVVLVKS